MPRIPMVKGFKLPQLHLTKAQLEQFMKRITTREKGFTPELTQGKQLDHWAGPQSNGSFKVPAAEDPLTQSFNRVQEMLGPARVDAKLAPAGNPLLDEQRLEAIASDRLTGKSSAMPLLANRQIPGTAVPTQAFPPTFGIPGSSGLDVIRANQAAGGAANPLLSSPEDVFMARFYKPHPDDPSIQLPVDMPWEEGRRIFLDPKRLSEFSGTLRNTLPPVIKTSRTEAGSVDDITGSMAAGIAQKRLQYKPVYKAADFKAKKKGEVSVEEKPKVRALLEKEFTAEEARAAKPTLTAIDEGMTLWKAMGGGRSSDAKMWDNYIRGARGVPKGTPTKEYFVRSYAAYKREPNTFRKNNPRQARSLDDLIMRYMKGEK